MPISKFHLLFNKVSSLETKDDEQERRKKGK